MQESYERVRKGANVKGRVELKIDKTQSKRPLVTLSPNYPIPTPTVSVLTSTYTQIKKRIKVIDRSRDVTLRSKYDNRRGTQAPPVPQIWCNSDYYLQSHGILKKLAHAILFRLAVILKVSVELNRFFNST